MIAAVGGHGVIWTGVVSKVLIPAVSPAVMAAIVAGVGTWLVYRIDARRPGGAHRNRLPLRPDRLGIAGLAGARHQRRAEDDGRDLPGADLLRRGRASPTRCRRSGSSWPARARSRRAPTSAAGGSSARWARVSSRSSRRRAWPRNRRRPPSSCCPATSATRCPPPRSRPARSSAAALGKPGAEVRWGVAGRMATAWLITLPAAGLVGAFTYFIVHGIGGYAGAIIGFLLLAAVSVAIWRQSRKDDDRPQQRQQRVGGQPDRGHQRGRRPAAAQQQDPRSRLARHTERHRHSE